MNDFDKEYLDSMVRLGTDLALDRLLVERIERLCAKFRAGDLKTSDLANTGITGDINSITGESFYKAVVKLMEETLDNARCMMQLTIAHNGYCKDAFNKYRDLLK